MRFEEFEALIEAYGAEPSRWPKNKQADMQFIIQAHPVQAKAVIETASALDEMLDVVPSASASDLLKTRIQKAAQAVTLEVQNTTLRNGSSQARKSSGWARLAAMVTVSFSAGFAGAQFVELPQGGGTALVEFIASVDTSDEWEVAATELGFAEIYEWTSGEDIDVTLSDL